MVFESLFKPEAGKSEEELAIEQAIQAAKDKIIEKTTDDGEAEYFNTEYEKNLKKLKSKGGPGVFQHSQELMLIVKKNPQLVDERVILFHPKTD